MTEPNAFFMDGKTAKRHPVTVLLTESDIEITQGDIILAAWPFSIVRRQDGPADILRLGIADEIEKLKRLETNNPALMVDIERLCPLLDAQRETAGKTLKIVAWSIAATISAVLLLFFVIPALVPRLVNYVPVSVEKYIGRVADKQIRFLFSNPVTCSNPAGVRALDRLIAQLAAQASYPIEPEVVVLSHSLENAFALPGGRIYLFKGLLNKARSPDELAGVLAHEMSHVFNRDGMRLMLQTGGTSFVIGVFLGDITGGSSLVIALNLLTQSSYSRDIERDSDTFSAKAMLSLGRDPVALGRLLERLENQENDSNALSFFSTHPLTGERAKNLSEMGVPEKGAAPLLTNEEWLALKQICVDPSKLDPV